MEKSAPDTDDIPATDERAPSQPPRHSAPRPMKSGARKSKPASAARNVEPVKPVVMDGTPANGPARKPDLGGDSESSESEPEPVARGKGRGQKQAKAAKGRPARRGGPRVYKKVLYYNHKRVRVDEVDDSSDSDEPSYSDVEESEEEHETTRRPRMRRVARRPTLRRAAPRKVTYADKLIGDGDEDDEDRGGDRADDAVEGAGPFYYM
eukprot:jgi/Tetstr1/443585/TSEL_031584.t1